MFLQYKCVNVRTTILYLGICRLTFYDNKSIQETLKTISCHNLYYMKSAIQIQLRV